MRIEKRGDEEYLIGAPVECDGCDEVHVEEGACCHHLNGEHLAVAWPDSDGACKILARWPIEPIEAPVRVSPRPAEEVAREMLTQDEFLGTASDWFRDRLAVKIASAITRAREEGAATALHGVAQADREHLGREVRAVWVSWAREQPSPKPSWLVSWEGISEPDREVDRRIGERLFAMGAAAERARQQPADVALYPAPDAPGQWVAHHVTRDLVTQGDSEPHALRMLAEAIEMMDGAPEQPRDLAGRIRALIQEYAGRWADHTASNADTLRYQYNDVLMWLRSAFRGATLGRGVEHALETLRALGRDSELHRQAADDLEAIARECAPERER